MLKLKNIQKLVTYILGMIFARQLSSIGIENREKQLEILNLLGEQILDNYIRDFDTKFIFAKDVINHLQPIVEIVTELNPEKMYFFIENKNKSSLITRINNEISLNIYQYFDEKKYKICLHDNDHTLPERYEFENIESLITKVKEIINA